MCAETQLFASILVKNDLSPTQARNNHPKFKRRFCRSDITMRNLFQMSSGLRFSGFDSPRAEWEQGRPDHALMYSEAIDCFEVRNAPPLRFLCNTMLLPRQAWDERKENSSKKGCRAVSRYSGLSRGRSSTHPVLSDAIATAIRSLLASSSARCSTRRDALFPRLFGGNTEKIAVAKTASGQSSRKNIETKDRFARRVWRRMQRRLVTICRTLSATCSIS